MRLLLYNSNQADSDGSYTKVSSEDTFENVAFINPREFFHMGDKVWKL